MGVLPLFVVCYLVFPTTELDSEGTRADRTKSLGVVRWERQACVNGSRSCVGVIKGPGFTWKPGPSSVN